MYKKKSLSFIFVILLIALLLPPLRLIGSAETTELTVYISSAGNGENSGLTEDKPVSTLGEAVTVANEKTGGQASARVRFVLLSNLAVAKNPYGTAPFSFQLTVTGKTGNEVIKATSFCLNHTGNTRYENLHFTQGSTSNYAFLCANGYELVLGTGLTCSPNANGYYLNVTGGVYGDTGTTFVSDSSLTVLSGEWETLYAGSYKDSQTGDAVLYAENCTVHSNVGTAYTKTHTGTSTITLKNCELAVKSTGMLQGGPTNAAGNLTGKLTMVLEDCNVRDFGVGFKRSITAPLSLTVKNCTVKDAYSVTATGESEIILCASEGKTLDLTPATTFNATTFNGGGTLILGDAGLLVAERVNGSTTLSFAGGTPAEKAYVRSPAETAYTAFVYKGSPALKIRTENGEKIWTFSSAVILKAPEAMTLTLSTGFDEGSEVPCDFSYTEQDETFYVFYGLAPGKYRYNVKGGSYYQVTKNILLTEEKVKNDLLIDCTPPLRAETGFEPSPSANANVKDYTDEMRENYLVSDSSAWPDYDFVFNSPYFTRDSYETGLHQATTQEEMMAYLEECVEKNKNLYLYSLGKSPSYGFDIPMVIFTSSDLSQAKTLAEAAELCRENGKLTFQYQAQVHGNEPAAGEGALAMIGALASGWGDRFIDDMNICIIPRINTDGSYAYTRNQVTINRNLNRDYLLLEADEIPMILQAYNLFRPQVVVDGHEYTVSTASSSGAFNDAALGTGGNESADPGFEETGVEMMLEAFDHLAENGLQGHFYTSQDDSTDPTTARAYYQMRGAVSLLLETSGIHGGQNGIHRRVITQFLCMETYLNYAKTHSAELRSLAEKSRKDLIDAGSSYSEDRSFPLKTEAVTHSQTYPKTVYNYSTGLATGTKNATAKSNDNVTASRPLPTAYVIPRDSYSDAILRVIRAHNISYYELAPDTAAFLLGYNGAYDASSKAVTEVALTREALVSFPDGAYVFPMNQDGALILAAMFEPDNLDIYNTSDKTYTLAQRGMVPYLDGSFAMYRSQRDLTEGKIEAIAAPDAPAGLSVSQDANGSLTGTVTGLDPTILYEIRHESESSFSPLPAGSTTVENVLFGFVELRVAATETIPASKLTRLEILPPASALPTVYLAPESGSDTAFGTESDPVKTLDKAMALMHVLHRYSDEKPTLIFTEVLNTTAALTFPAHDYPLFVTSKTGSEGIRSSKNITFGGETVVDDFTFTYTGTSYVYIVANGHKVTLGEKVRSVAEKNVYYMPTGGGHESVVESTHLTVLAGTWRNIYAGGYRGGVEKDVVLIAKNCTVVSHIQNSYSGKTEGNVTIELENVTVQTSILCGNAAKQDVVGNVSLTAKDCTIAELYAGSRDDGNVLGSVTVALEGCNAGSLYGVAKNESGTVGESHLILTDTEPTGTVSGWTTQTTGGTEKGDADGNGTVSVEDAVYLLFAINFPETYPFNQPSDYDGSGTVDTDDAIHLLFHINFPDGYPLH